MGRTYATDAKKRQTQPTENSTRGTVPKPSKAGVPPFLAVENSDTRLEAEAERSGTTLASIQPESSLTNNALNAKVHTGESAQVAAQRKGARAFTTGDDIYFNRGEFNPSTAAGRALIGHEMAHVAQQRAGQSQGVQRKALSDDSEASRKKLELPSAPTTIPEEVLKEYFEKLEKGWGASRPAPKGVTVELQGIKDEYKTPMTSVAMYMNAQVSYASTVTGVTKAMFGPGTSITLRLALAKHGLADGNYRFSWTGDDQSGTIYIESMAAGPKDENAPTEAGGKIAVGGLNFEVVGTWSSEQMGYLKKALALIPLSALKEVDGLKFEVGSGSGNGSEDGKFDPDKHKVIMQSSAFSVSDVRFGESPKPVQELAHEIGHAIDLSVLNKAWKKYESSGKSKDLTSVASPSGSKWEKGKGKDDPWEMAERIAKTDGDFRTAATRDGVTKTTTEITDENGDKQKLAHLKGGISDYGNTNWTELYAESFALYTTDPATLKLLRPNIYAYFVGKYPRKTP